MTYKQWQKAIACFASFCFRLLGFAWFCLLYTCIFGQYKKYKCILLYADGKGSHLKCYPLELSRPDTALFQEVKTVSAALWVWLLTSCLRSGSHGLPSPTAPNRENVQAVKPCICLCAYLPIPCKRISTAYSPAFLLPFRHICILKGF